MPRSLRLASSNFRQRQQWYSIQHTMERRDDLGCSLRASAGALPVRAKRDQQHPPHRNSAPATARGTVPHAHATGACDFSVQARPSRVAQPAYRLSPGLRLPQPATAAPLGAASFLLDVRVLAIGIAELTCVELLVREVGHIRQEPVHERRVWECCGSVPLCDQPFQLAYQIALVGGAVVCSDRRVSCRPFVDRGT